MFATSRSKASLTSTLQLIPTSNVQFPMQYGLQQLLRIHTQDLLHSCREEEHCKCADFVVVGILSENLTSIFAAKRDPRVGKASEIKQERGLKIRCCLL